MTADELVALAREAALKAYAPYSRFHVGCAVESVDGEIVTGANMENACYRLGICAEHQLPVRYVGIGERAEDLREFDADEFVEAMLGRPGAEDVNA